MKSIVCYGDSNTWGCNPSDGSRFAIDVRWPGVMRNALGKDYWVIEEGLGGRTTVWDDPLEGQNAYTKNGRKYLSPCLASHQPFDLIAIMLGTNDLKKRFSLPPSDIAIGAGKLIEIVKTSGSGLHGKSPDILLICPPPVAPIDHPRFIEMFEGAEEKSKLLAQNYKAIAFQYGVHFLDAGQFVHSSPIDSIHLEPDAHHKLGLAMADKVRQIFTK
jgi:lysophospholipase L1-like esterase